MTQDERGPEQYTPRADPAVIDDLRARLRATRWPDAPDDAGWSLGTDLDYLRELVEYWIDGFDWRAQEDAIARLPHFRVGSAVSASMSSTPERRTAAAPSCRCCSTTAGRTRSGATSRSFPLLTDPGAHGGDPADAFDVIVPDMPGFGYSDPPAHPFTSIDVAAHWAELMTVLGYDRFVTAGGDIGSGVSRYLALDHPDRVVAVHRMDAGLPFFAGDRSVLSDEERAWLDDAATWGAAEGAYAAMHRTKPQTAAFALTDSPVGLAAWIVEKLRSWSDCGGDIERCFTKDEILTLLTQYWVTGTIGSSMRMYNANATISAEQLSRRVEVPSGFSIFPADIVRPPREWLDRAANVVRATEPAQGGHFAPFEQPELYAAELREFFRPFRASFAP